MCGVDIHSHSHFEVLMAALMQPFPSPTEVPSDTCCVVVLPMATDTQVFWRGLTCSHRHCKVCLLQHGFLPSHRCFEVCLLWSGLTHGQRHFGLIYMGSSTGPSPSGTSSFWSSSLSRAAAQEQQRCPGHQPAQVDGHSSYQSVPRHSKAR